MNNEWNINIINSGIKAVETSELDIARFRRKLKYLIGKEREDKSI